MRDRFIALWDRIKAQGSAEQEFSMLKSLYSESYRFYHNMTHVENCLTELDSVRNLVQQSDLVELAIWYHDAVYDVKAKNNEG